MSATDELRRMLDERGVEWEQSPQDGWYRTEWTGRYGKCNAMEWKPALTVMMPNLTPEQAIAATLGDKRDRTEEWLLNACNQAAADYIAELERKLEAATLGGGKLTAEQVREAISENAWEETSTLFEFGDSSWQAIADELNAAMGGGECEWELEHSGTLYDKWRCSKCKFLFVEPRCDQGYTDLVPNFCPNCGKAVKQ